MCYLAILIAEILLNSVLFVRVIRREISKYEKWEQDEFYKEIDYDNIFYNEVEELTEAFISSPFRVVLAFIGYDPIKMRLGLFNKRKFYYSSKPVTWVAFVLIILIILIFGTSKILTKKTTSQYFKNQFDEYDLNINNNESFPLKLQVFQSETSKERNLTLDDFSFTLEMK